MAVAIFVLSIVFLISVGSLFGWVDKMGLKWLVAELVALIGLVSVFTPLENDLTHDLGGKESNSLKYLQFKGKLNVKGINKQDVEKCLQLVDMQIDICSTTKEGLKKYSSWLIVFGLGVLATLWSGLEITHDYAFSSRMI